MKHKNIFFLTLCACVFLLSNAVGYWNVRSILTSAPWTSVETLDDFDTDGTFVLDTIECHNQWFVKNQAAILPRLYSCWSAG